MADDHMVVGTLSLKLAIFEAVSLKDKRRVVKSLKDRLRNRFNVSVAEVGSLDRWQQAELGVALVANDGQFVESALDKVVAYVRQDSSASLVDYEVEVF
jgi:uncharacterized protein